MHYVGTSIGKQMKCFILVKSYQVQKCCEIKSVVTFGFEYISFIVGYTRFPNIYLICIIL